MGGRLVRGTNRMGAGSEGRCLPPSVNESRCALLPLHKWGMTLRHHGIRGIPTRTFLERQSTVLFVSLYL